MYESTHALKTLILFVLRFYHPVNPLAPCWAQSVNLTTLLLGSLSSKQLTSIVHILLPETDNCPSWISGRERMIIENISWSLFTKECFQAGGGQSCTLPITSWMRIHLSHWGRLKIILILLACAPIELCAIVMLNTALTISKLVKDLHLPALLTFFHILCRIHWTQTLLLH